MSIFASPTTIGKVELKVSLEIEFAIIFIRASLR